MPKDPIHIEGHNILIKSHTREQREALKTFLIDTFGWKYDQYGKLYTSDNQRIICISCKKHLTPKMIGLIPAGGNWVVCTNTLCIIYSSVDFEDAWNEIDPGTPGHVS